MSLGLSRWVDTGPCEASSTTPCWGPIVPLGGFAEGSVNAVDVFDPVEGTTLAPGTFGEAVINLTDAGVFDLEECVTFGSAYVKSRSSTSFTSQLKDFIEPIDVSVSNCATITVTKNAIPDDDQDFHFNGPRSWEPRASSSTTTAMTATLSPAARSSRRTSPEP